MKYRKLSDTDIKVSVICFGAWAIGGDAWGKVDDEESIYAIHAAIDQGINFFDTAPIYGKGHSEEILGKALKSKRKDVVIATKFGLVWDDRGNVTRDSSVKNMLRELDASLKRLNTDYIDLYQVHWPDPYTPIEEIAEALEQVRQEGKIRAIGVSNYSIDQIETFRKCAPLHSVQPPYHLLARNIERDLLPYCSENNISVITYGTIGHGLFTGKMTEHTTFGEDDWRRNIDLFQGETFKRNLQLVEKLKKLAESMNMTVSQLAISWVLSNSAITSAIVGAKNERQVKENAIAGNIELCAEAKLAIENIFQGISPYREYSLD